MVNKKRVGMMVAVTLLTGVLLFCSVFFLVRRANREITQRSFDELATATRQIAKDLADAANADQTILSAMAELIAGHDERDNDAVLRIMKSFSLNETFVSTVALLRPDGTLLLWVISVFSSLSSIFNIPPINSASFRLISTQSSRLPFTSIKKSSA